MLGPGVSRLSHIHDVQNLEFKVHRQVFTSVVLLVVLVTLYCVRISCSATLIFEVELVSCNPRKGSSLGSVSEERARLEYVKSISTTFMVLF